VKVVIQNFGTDTIKTANNLRIAFSLNGNTPVITPYAFAPLAPMMIDTVTLPNILITAGQNNICAYTLLAGDSNTFNDTICKAFYGTPHHDAGVTMISAPSANLVQGTNAVVNVQFKNFGIDTITSMNLGYKVNGTVQATQLWTGVLPPNASDSMLFTQNFVVPSASFSICAYTSLTNDGDHTNDTTCKTSYGVFTSNLPYYDNFDGNIWSYGDI